MPGLDSGGEFNGFTAEDILRTINIGRARLDPVDRIDRDIELSDVSSISSVDSDEDDVVFDGEDQPIWTDEVHDNPIQAYKQFSAPSRPNHNLSFMSTVLEFFLFITENFLKHIVAMTNIYAQFTRSMVGRHYP